MREGTYPPRRVPEHCTQPQSWELSAWMWLWVRLLWVLSLSWAGRDCQWHPLLSGHHLWVTGPRRGGKAAAAVCTRCLWGPSDQIQSGFRSLLAD